MPALCESVSRSLNDCQSEKVVFQHQNFSSDPNAYKGFGACGDHIITNYFDPIFDSQNFIPKRLASTPGKQFSQAQAQIPGCASSLSSGLGLGARPN